MQAQFLCPPMLGLYLKDEAKADEAPIRQCLIVAWDDHSENYLVVDRESGEQRWLGIVSVQVDCDSLISSYNISDPNSKPHNHEGGVGKDDDDDEDDDEDRCPVCKQKMP